MNHYHGVPSIILERQVILKVFLLLICSLTLTTSAIAKKKIFSPEGYFLYGDSQTNEVRNLKEAHKNIIENQIDSSNYRVVTTIAWKCIVANNNNTVDDFEVFCRAWLAKGVMNSNYVNHFDLNHLAWGFTFLDSYSDVTGDTTYDKLNESLKSRYTEYLAADYAEPLTEGYYFSEEQGKGGSPKFILQIMYDKATDEWLASILPWCDYNCAINILDLSVGAWIPITMDDSEEVPRYVAVWGNQRVKEANAGAANSWFTSSYNFQRDMTGKIASSKWKSSDKTYATIATTAVGGLMDGLGLLIANSGSVKETDVSLEWVPNGDGSLTAIVHKLVITNNDKQKVETNRFTLHKFYPHQKIGFYCKEENINKHCIQNDLVYFKEFFNNTSEPYQQIWLKCFDAIRYNPFLTEGLKKKTTKKEGLYYGEWQLEFWKTLDREKFNNAMYKYWALEEYFTDMPDEFRALLPEFRYAAKDGYIYLGQLDKKGNPKGLVAIRDRQGNISYSDYSKK